LRTTRLVAVLSLVCVLIVLAERPAYAYADPGTGALLWQLMAASLFGLLFYLRRGLLWLKEIFKRANEKNLD
jgi:hypothetical protein